MLAEARKEPGKLPAGVLAVLVHAILIGVLIFGVNWQNKHPAPVEAEIWNKLPSAPRQAVEPPSPPPKPVAKKEVEEKPVVKPKPEVKKQPEPEKAQPKPDIALKEKLEKKKHIEEEKLKVEQEKLKQAELKKKEAEKKKLAEEKQKQQEQEQDETIKNLLAAQKAAKEKAHAAQAASAANASNAIVGTYIDRIRTKIRQNTNLPDIAGQPSVTYKLVLLPSGDLLSVKLVKPSGNTAYDEAVERGIRSAAPLPLPPDPSLFSNFRELTLPLTLGSQ